jgi:hypothetical protein
LCEVHEQRLADRPPPKGGAYVQVFQIEAGPREKCRKIVKVQRERRRLIVAARDDRLRASRRAEQGFAQLLFVGDHLILELFIDRKFADHGEQQRDVGRGRRFDS